MKKPWLHPEEAVMAKRWCYYMIHVGFDLLYKIRYLKEIFLILSFKCVLCILIRIASLKPFWWANSPLFYRRSKDILNYLHLYTDLVLWLTMSGETAFRITFTTVLIQQMTNCMMIVSYFSQKKLETICMKCQNLFCEENKKNISICRLLKTLPEC